MTGFNVIAHVFDGYNSAIIVILTVLELRVIQH